MSDNNNTTKHLFAYIKSNNSLTAEMAQMYNSSLIFIGDEEQIWHPYTNTYIGIGASYFDGIRDKATAANSLLQYSTNADNSYYITSSNNANREFSSSYVNTGLKYNPSSKTAYAIFYEGRMDPKDQWGYIIPQIVHVSSVSISGAMPSMPASGTLQLSAIVLPSDATDKSVTWSSSDTSVAIVDSSGLVTAIGVGSTTITATTNDGSFTDTCTIISYGGIEIGGVIWATMNVGATSIYDPGLFFQWGDPQGYSPGQVGNVAGEKGFSPSDYKYTNDGGTTFIKYNSSDGLTTLESNDDMATQNMGASWRLPTKEDFDALISATNYSWTNDYENSGAKGIVLTSKDDSTKKLFFPANGYALNGATGRIGTYGYVWCSTIYTSNIRDARRLDFNSSGISMNSMSARWHGFGARGVIKSIIIEER